MSLFAALTAKDGADAGPAASAPPEALQLHADRALDFLAGSSVRLRAPAPSPAEGAGGDGADAGRGGYAGARGFAALAYQAAQTRREDGGAGGDAGGERRHPRPDLGVWDCRVRDGDGGAAALLLRRVVVRREAPSGAAEQGAEGTADGGRGASPPIVLAVDLTDPAEVQPAVERMCRVILSAYARSDENEATEANGAAARDRSRQRTTSLSALRTAPFGQARVQEPAADAGPRIALILAALVPRTPAAAEGASAAEEYGARQARALLRYHLHKFCLEVDCTLCFVGDAGGEGSGAAAEAAAEGAAPPDGPATLSVDALGRLVRRVALGLPPTEGGDDDATEDADGGVREEGAGAAPARPPAVHAPGTHDAALVRGAYLRHAACEGRWDAGVDDLAAALPPRARAAGAPAAREGGGDAGWLAPLAASVGLAPAAASPVPAPRAGRRDSAAGAAKKRPAVARNRAAGARGKDAKPKDEKEVMNFFDNLLKK